MSTHSIRAVFFKPLSPNALASQRSPDQAAEDGCLPRRRLAGLFKLAAWALSLVAIGLASTNSDAQIPGCRDSDLNGTGECTATPIVQTDWRYGIPGPIQATGDFGILGEAVGAYIGIIVESVTSAGYTFCEGPTSAPAESPFSGSFYSAFDYGRFEQQRNTGIGFYWKQRLAQNPCWSNSIETF